MRTYTTKRASAKSIFFARCSLDRREGLGASAHHRIAKNRTDVQLDQWNTELVPAGKACEHAVPAEGSGDESVHANRRNYFQSVGAQ
jgi:hypothetical protein